MRPIRSLISLEDAREMCLDAVEAIERTEEIDLIDALGRVLAEDVTAHMPVPGFDRAAMDGYAVRAEDTYGAGKFNPRKLKCVEVLYTGQLPRRGLSAGECIEIATGAVMPQGADAVVRVEDTEKEGDVISIYVPAHPQLNVGKAGEDIAPGTVILHDGDLLNPARIGVLSSLGHARVPVYKRPRVYVLSTGDEVVEPGRELRQGQIYDINSRTLAAAIKDNGGDAVFKPIVEDEKEEVAKAVEECLDGDMIVFSGGSSVGERDLIMDAMSEMGEILFHGIAVKPGKPTLLARIKDRVVMGMPGYPTSCLSNAYILLVPMLRRMARLPRRAHDTVTRPMSRRITSPLGRHQILTVRVEEGVVVPAFKESGAITSMALADGFIEIPANVEVVEKGEPVEVKLF